MLRRADETRCGSFIGTRDLFADAKGAIGQDALHGDFLANTRRPFFDEARITTQERNESDHQEASEREERHRDGSYRRHAVLPVLPLEGRDLEAADAAIEATEVDIEGVRMGAGRPKWQPPPRQSSASSTSPVAAMSAPC